MQVATNGTTLYAERRGTGTPIVFVHGMCGDGRVWDGQVRRLRDRFSCTVYDRRGHSRSPRADVPGQPETVQMHADDLAGLIEALDLAPCLVVGSSGGARVTVDLIRRHAHLVRAAVVSEPPIGGLAPDAFGGLIDEIAPRVKRAVESDGPRAAVDAFFGAVCPGLWAIIDEPIKDRYRDNADMLFADLAMPRYEITAADVGAIDVPTLVVAGARSHVALATGARNLATWLPNGQLLELDCGHVTYAEEPDAFASAVAAFADSHASTPVASGT